MKKIVLIIVVFSGCGEISYERYCSQVDRSSGSGNVATTPVLNNDLTQAQMIEILRQTNAVRVKGKCRCPAAHGDPESNQEPVGKLAWHQKLEKAAAFHSADMVTNNFFDHTGSGGDTVADRVSAQGYVWWYVNENIAAGYTTVTDVMTGWLESGGHCRNIMSSEPKEIGVSMMFGTGSNTYSTYWTMNMAKR